MKAYSCLVDVESSQWTCQSDEVDPAQVEFNVCRWGQRLESIHVLSDVSVEHGIELIQDEVRSQTERLQERGLRIVVRADRLTKLADHLSTINPEMFDLSNWAVERACGTVCCAFGHAPTIFPELCLLPYGDKEYLVWWSDRDLDDGSDTQECIEEFFGIDMDVAECIFFPYKYSNYYPSTLENVITRIRHYVETGKIYAR